MICRNKDKGFTFIELILYMAILGIFMVAVMSLISTTVASHKKQSSRQKLQSQATETYDAIADILMGASDIKIDGTAYVQTGTSFTQVTGSFIVEKIFTIPGLGSEFIGAITGRDYPLIMGTTIFLAAFIILMNLVVDLLYKVADPRISLAKGGE